MRKISKVSDKMNTAIYSSRHERKVTSLRVTPIFAGEGVTLTPADLRASIFSSAPPLPPEMIAPA